MYNPEMIAGLKRIQKKLARGKGRNSRDCAVMAEIIQKLEDEQHRYGTVTWSLEDILHVFADQEIENVPEEALIAVGEEADSALSDMMIETGWDVLLRYVEDYIHTHPELKENQ